MSSRQQWPMNLRASCTCGVVSSGSNSGVPATEVAAWAGHSVEMLMRVYARCMTGLEDVWISRMDGALRLGETQRARSRTGEKEDDQMSAHERQSTPARVGAYWAWNLASDSIRWHLLSQPATGPCRGTPDQGPFRGYEEAPPVGFEPTHPAPEADALSPELWGLSAVGKGTSEWALP